MYRLFRRLFEVLVGTLFIYWSWKLIYPIETFEFKLVEQFNLNWMSVSIISRITIALICFTGLWTLLGQLRLGPYFKGFYLLCVLLGTYDMLWKIINHESIIRLCYGCQVNSVIWLNALLLISCWVLFFISKRDNFKSRNQRKWRKVLLPISMPIIITIVYILNPVFYRDLAYNQGGELLNSHLVLADKSELNLDNTLICCFSVGCRFCKYGAQKLKVTQSNNENYPNIYVFYLGDEERVDEFEEITNTSFDYEILEDDSFFNVSGNRLPSIIRYVDGEPQGFWAGRDISYGVLDYFSERPKKD